MHRPITDLIGRAITVLGIIMPIGAATITMPNNAHAITQEDADNYNCSLSDELICDMMRREAAGKKRMQAWTDAITKQEAEDAKPENRLARTYRLHSIIQRCKSAREGFAQVYVSEPQYAESRNLAKRIEDALVAKNKLDSDKIWAANSTDAAIQQEFLFGIGGLDYSSCQQALLKLREQAAAVAPVGPPKKDF